MFSLPGSSGSAFRRTAWKLTASALLWTSLTANAGDLQNAPPTFSHEGRQAIPVDFTYYTLELEFDVSTQKALGKATIEFRAEQAGLPYMDMVANPTSVTLNGRSLPPATLQEVSSPGGTTKVRVLNAPVAANSTNTLEIRYTLPSSVVSFTATGVRIGFFMSDVGSDRSLLELYAPSNLEFDHFEMVANLSIFNGGAHRLFTNGVQSEMGGNRWMVRFPNYFTASSFYLHLSNQEFAVSESEYQGMEKTIPITIYASSASSVTSAMSASKQILQELEATYGPWAHRSLVAYIAGAGGMEYCGATMTSLSALGHELTHSWFARGVMPANGNAGWIDEAVASWRDNGYPTPATPLTTAPFILGGFSPWRRTTTYDAYSKGARLIAEFDRMFKTQFPNGFKTVLKKLFEEHHHDVITTPYFQEYLETMTGSDLESIFQRYVYGADAALLSLNIPAAGQIDDTIWYPSHHPRPYTDEELKLYR